ncbi:hypothetical protein [Sphingomonas oryzagri]
MTGNPLWTDDQAAAEKLALRLIEREDVRAAREAARRAILDDPLAATLDGIVGLDRALDQWVLGLAMREANGDTADPKVVWNISNAPRDWYGHVYRGAAVAIDNPDNFNREIPIDGDGTYEITIRFAANPPMFSIVCEVEPEHHAGLGRNLGAYTLQQLSEGSAPGEPVIVTVGPGEGGRFHLKTEPGARIQVYTRDSQRDWDQVPAEVSVRRLNPPAGHVARTEDEIAAAVIADMPAWVHFWSHFKDDFLGLPPFNSFSGPHGREGGWGYLAGGRFRLASDAALIVTTDPAGSYYTGFQISDPWTISPDPMVRLVSLNTSQVAPNPDGTLTFALAAVDPGLANWIDTTNLAEGWIMIRWQGVPAAADPATFLRETRVVPLERIEAEVPATVPRIEIAGRRRQLAERARSHGTRTRAAEWTR